jgi:site-specific DNA-cytosine methylase
MGLFMAGFNVLGHDNREQREYPFDFVNDCALTADISKADFIWASPPCQKFSGIIPTSVRAKYGHLWNHENLIPPIRAKLALSGKPYVIENVQGACSELQNPVMLCGNMFDNLRVFRHRLFENNFGLRIERKCNHTGKSLGRRSPSSRSAVNRPLDDVASFDGHMVVENDAKQEIEAGEQQKRIFASMRIARIMGDPKYQDIQRELVRSIASISICFRSRGSHSILKRGRDARSP